MENISSNPYQAPESDLNTPTDEQNLAFGEPQKRPAGKGTDWIKSAFLLFKQSPGTWILTMILGFIIVIVTNLIPVVGSIFGFVTTYIWTAGLIYGSSQQDKGLPFKVSYLFSGFKLAPGKLIGLSVAMGVLSMLIMLICMGPMIFDMMMGQFDETSLDTDPLQFILYFLIAMALMLPLMMATWFAPALIIFHQFGLIRAMKYSFMACLKNFVAFLVYGLVFFLIMIIAMIPAGLGMLVVVPMLYASMYTAYKDIFLREQAE